MKSRAKRSTRPRTVRPSHRRSKFARCPPRPKARTVPPLRWRGPCGRTTAAPNHHHFKRLCAQQTAASLGPPAWSRSPHGRLRAGGPSASKAPSHHAAFLPQMVSFRRRPPPADQREQRSDDVTRQRSSSSGEPPPEASSADQRKGNGPCSTLPRHCALQQSQATATGDGMTLSSSFPP
jgi:hypothetical protein